MFSDQNHKHSDGEVPFVLSDTSPETFLILLEFIYTNCATLSSKIVNILPFMDIFLNYWRILYMIEFHLIKLQAIDVLGIAIEYGMDALRKVSLI